MVDGNAMSESLQVAPKASRERYKADSPALRRLKYQSQL